MRPVRGARIAVGCWKFAPARVLIVSAASFQAALERLAERLASELLIEYIVPVGSKPNDVKLGVRLVGARVRGLGVAPK